MEFRLFMKSLIRNCGVGTIAKFVEGQCPLVTEMFELEKNSYFFEFKMFDRITVNENGQRVAAVPIDPSEIKRGVIIIDKSRYSALEMVPKEMKVVDFVDLTDEE